MCRKLICLSFVLVLGLIGSASADTIEWLGTADTSWGNLNNWYPAKVPVDDIALFEDDSSGTTCVISSNRTVKVVHGPGYSDNAVFDASGNIVGGAPSVLTINSGVTLDVGVYLRAANDSDGWGILNVESGSTLNIAGTLYFCSDGIGTLNINGGAVNAVSLMLGFTGGDALANLDTGTIDVSGVWIGRPYGERGDGRLDIDAGTLTIHGGDYREGDYRGSIASMMYDGAITAYDGRGRIVSVYTADPCQTVVTGVQDLTVAYDPDIESTEDSNTIGDIEMYHDAILSWKAGDGAVSHNVYLSPIFDDVNDATSPADDCFVGNYAIDHNYVDDAFLEFGSVIYWRVDEVGASTVRGNIWRFWTDNGMARNPKPADAAVDVNAIGLELEWDRAPGRIPYSVNYNVYFSEDYDEVSDVEVDNTAVSYCIASNQDANAISMSVVKLDTTYYWRVDTKAIADPCTVRGDVWSCTTSNNYDVETFEGYKTFHQLEDYWTDTGGVLDYYSLDRDDPYSGDKCLEIEFWTYDSPYYGGASRSNTTYPWNTNAPTWADWTFGGSAEALSLWFSPGDKDPNLSINGIDELYARITDSSSRVALVHYSDNWPVSNFDNGGHQEWNIALQDFIDDNSSIDLTNVITFEIGFLDGLGNPPAQGGEGNIFFDQIRLYARRCVPSYGLMYADLNDDCFVNGGDLAIMAEDWLDFHYSMMANPVDPCDPNLVAHWKLDEDMFSEKAIDYSQNSRDAEIIAGPILWDPSGRIDGCMDKPTENSDEHLNAGGGKEEGDENTWADITGELTLTAWLRPDFQGGWDQLHGVVGKGREEAWEMHKSCNNKPELYEYVRTMSMYVCVPGMPWYGVHGLQNCWDYKWHHFAGVYKIYQPGVSSEVIVYTDGVKENTLSLFGDPIETCDYPVTIGNNSNQYATSQWHHNWWGKIDDVRIYDRALDHEEIVGLVKEGTLGPLAHYAFDNGTADDISGNENHGSLVSGATIVYDADRDSNVLDVGDANGYVDCGGGHDLSEPNCTLDPANCTWADFLGEFTVMAWVKPSMTERGHYCGTVVSKGDWDGGYSWNYPTDPNRNREGWSMIRQGWNNAVSFSIVGSADVLSDMTPITGIVLDLFDVNTWDGAWHHIALSYDNLNYMDVYIDGLHASHHHAKDWDDDQTIGTNNYHIFIGASSGEIQGGGSYADPATGFKGLIDDVRVYDQSMTQIAIASVMADADLYVPLDSLANLYNAEGMSSRIINFRDYQMLAIEWLEDTAYPFAP